MSGQDVVAPPPHWHFVGIGGVGMSACAALAHERGHVVTGSDLQPSATIEDLQRKGMRVFATQEAANLADGVDAVVVSTIISEDNPELAAARRRGIRVLHRSQALAELARDRFHVGVLGSAGKGTTAGAVTSALERDGRAPGFYLGWRMRDHGTSTRDGARLMVLEIDESDGSMRNFSPDAVVITNLYAEHLDYYRDLPAIVAEFRDWLQGNPRLRTVVLNADDPGCRTLGSALRVPDAQVVWYGLDHPEGAAGGGARPVPDVRGSDIEAGLDELRFQLSLPGIAHREVRSPLGMGFNASNLLAAAAAATALGVDPDTLCEAFADYHGVEGRLEIADAGGSTFVGAYAAVPESVDAVVDQLCVTFGSDQVLVVFQPNRTWRLEEFMAPYAASLRKPGRVIVTDLAQTWTGQTARHRERERTRAGAAGPTPTAEDLVVAVGPRARYVPYADMAGELAAAVREVKAVAVLAGGESYLAEMRGAALSEEPRGREEGQ